MALLLRSLHDLPNTDGTIDRRYPLGNKPAVAPSSLGIDLAAFAAANINLTRLPQGPTVDFNYRTYLTGTSAATAVLSVSAASGSLSNWIVDASGNGISNTTVTAGSGSLFVSASDGTNAPVAFPVQNWSILSSTQQAATKAHPGNYFWWDNQYWPGNQKPNYDAHIAALKADSTVMGTELVFTWGKMSDQQLTSGQQTHNTLFGILDPILADFRANSRPFYLVIKLWQTFFNTQSITSTSDWPQWVVDKGNWIKAFTSNQGQTRTQMDFDNDQVWAALTKMGQNIGDRYNSDPNFECFTFFDESVAVTFNSANATVMNASHYNTKFLQALLDIKAHWPNTLVGVPMNFLPPGGSSELPTMTNMIQTLEAAYPGGFLYYGPDPAIQGVHGGGPTNWVTTFENLVTGQIGSLGDKRGQMLLGSHIEEWLLGNTGSPPTKPAVTPTQLYTSAVDIFKASHVFWNYQTWEYYKAADELAAIHARNGVTAALPPGNFVT